MRAGRPASQAGLVLALLSAAAFGTSGVLAASLLARGWSPGAAVTARVAVAAAVLTVPAVLALRGRVAVLRRQWRPVVGYGLVAVAGCQLCYFTAVPRVGVGVALLLEYLGSVLVVAWLWLRHGERPRRLTLAGAATAVAGLVIVLDVTGGARLDAVGVLWGLGAGVGLATYFVISAGSGGTREEVPPLVMAWAGMAVGACALGLSAVVGALPWETSTAEVVLAGRDVPWLVPVLLLALVAAAFAYVAGIGAARLLGAKVATFVGLTEVLFAVLFAWAVLDQLPTVTQLLGGAVIVLGVALVRADELRGAPAAPAPAAAGGPAGAVSEPVGALPGVPATADTR